MTIPNVPPDILADIDQSYAMVNEELDKMVAEIQRGIDANPEMAHNKPLLWAYCIKSYRDLAMQLPTFDDYVASNNRIADLLATATFRLTSSPDGDMPPEPPGLKADKPLDGKLTMTMAGLPDLPGMIQQLLGRAFLITLHDIGIDIDDVRIEFENT
jgi:hypothetical protein